MRGQPTGGVTGWPELVTLWALEDDSRSRERILVRHSLLMTVVERKALEAFRQASDAPNADWRFHLDAGVGYDLDRLEGAMEKGFGGFGATRPLYDAALKILGEARRAVRRQADAPTQAAARHALLRAAERLYDGIERRVEGASRRSFIADGIAKTQARLAEHDDGRGRLAAQLRRLSEARRRLAREQKGRTRCPAARRASIESF